MLSGAGAVLDGPGLSVTFSAGISALRPGDADGAALLQRADAAMYAAKHAGRDRTEMECPSAMMAD